MIDTTAIASASTPRQRNTQTYGSGVEFLVLGPVEYRVDDTVAALGGPKQRAVLAHLLANRGEVISLDSLIVGVWGPDGAPSLRSSVHTYISNLRVIIGYDIERVGDGYRLNVPPDTIDAFVFERMVEDAERQRSVNPATASHLARQALALWRGRAYADLADVHGLQPEILRLDDARLRAVELRVDTDIELGRHRAVIGELEALATEHPLNERLHAKLMLALYRDGRQAEALRVAGKLRAHLAESLGVDPTRALVELEDQILQHDPALDSLREARTEDLAFLFTDIEESTPLWESQPEWMRVSLARHDSVIADSVERHAGTIAKHTGDGVIAVFTSVKDAVGAAERAQRELTALDWGVLGPLNVRMAVDAGDVEVRNSDYFGIPMNRGSRLQAAAHGGQIVLSSVAHERLAGLAGIQTRNLGEYRLKGIGTPQRVFQLVADDLPSEFPALRVDGRRDDADGRAFGDTIRGYELRERIGAGRFGVVYRAYQPSIGREVAVKVLPETISNHPSFIRTFERDARLVAKLAHPHIVPLFDFWRDNVGAYFVMPLLPGSRPAPETRLPMASVAKIVDQVGNALSYAHRHGVLHRDLDPGSLLFDTDGNAYLSGFRIGTAALDDHMTDPYTTFRAPEQSIGVPADERTDVYGLGAIAAYLITGQTIEDLALSQLPAGDVLARATATDPAERFSTVDDFVAGFPTEGTERQAQTTPSRNPYKGLAAFDEVDAEDFFGRDEQIAALADLVRSHRLVTVVGPSGSGKSSLVRAGLLPALRSGAFAGSDDWLPVVMLPGAHPFDELLTALGSVATEQLGEMLAVLSGDDHGLLRLSKRIMRDLDGDLLLVIDQFEELYTLLANDQIRDRFVASLIEAVEDPHSRLRIVITIRADFFDQPLLDDRLGPVIAQTNLTVATPAPEQLLTAIRGPAQAARLELEGGLAERIVEDVRSEPGGLPLMQFTLQSLADASLPGWLTHEKYEGIGAVTGALSARADEVFDGLSEPDQSVAQRIMLRLVSVSEENDDVRRRVRQSELESLTADIGAVNRVLDAFGAARLLTFDRDPTTRGPTVEVAHEALLREWGRFRHWVDEQRGDLIIHRRFAAAMEEWRAADEHAEHLPTGGRLAQFEEWFPRAKAWLSEAERLFLRRAIERRDVERRRQAKRRRRIAASLVAAAVISAVMAGVAWVQASLASARELIAEAEIQLEEDPELAIHLGLESAGRFDRFGSIPARVTDLLREATAANPVVGRIPHGSSTAVSADGSLLVTVNDQGDGHAKLWDPVTLAPLGEIEPPGQNPFNYVYPQAVGDELYISTRRGDNVQEVWAWSVSRRQFVERLTSDAYLGHLMGWFQVSPGGNLVAESTEATLTVSERGSGDEIFQTLISSGSEHRFLHDDRIAVLADTDTGVRAQVHNLVTGEMSTDFAVEDEVQQPLFIQPSPDEETIIVASQVAIAAYESDTGTPLWMRDGSGRVFRPTWLPGDRIMVGGEGLAVILNAATGEVESTLPGHRGGTWSYTLIPGAELITSASLQGNETLLFDIGSRAIAIPIDEPLDVVVVADDGSALVRDREQVLVVTASGSVSAWFRGSAPAVTDQDTWGFPVMASSGQHLAYIGPAGESILWSITDATDVYQAPEGFSIRGISDDGSEVVISSGGDTQVVDVLSGRTVGKLDAGFLVSYAHFPSDDRYLITPSGGAPPLFRVWSRTDYSNVAGFGSADAFEWTGILTPDGQRFVTAALDGTLRIYDFSDLLNGATAAEALLDEIDAHNHFTGLVDISGDGRYLVSSAWDEPARVWDLGSGKLVATVGTVAPAVGFHPTEPLLYVAESGQLDILDIEAETVLEKARSSLTRDLTPDECETYLHRSCDSASSTDS